MVLTKVNLTNRKEGRKEGQKQYAPSTDFKVWSMKKLVEQEQDVYYGHRGDPDDTVTVPIFPCFRRPVMYMLSTLRLFTCPLV